MMGIYGNKTAAATDKQLRPTEGDSRGETSKGRIKKPIIKNLRNDDLPQPMRNPYS